MSKQSDCNPDQSARCELIEDQLELFPELNTEAMSAVETSEVVFKPTSRSIMHNRPKVNEEAIEGIDIDAIESEIAAVPGRLAYKIGDVADLLGVKPHVLRFWESEFEGFRPKKAGTGQRIFSQRDVETAVIIKNLLYRERFSIEGARGKLKDLRAKIRHDRKSNDESARLKRHTLDKLNRASKELSEVSNSIDHLISAMSGASL